MTPKWSGQPVTLRLSPVSQTGGLLSSSGPLEMSRVSRLRYANRPGCSRMNISATSLFHFTPRLESLKGIVQNGFRFSQLAEELPVRGYKSCIFDQLGVVQHIKYMKAVCFCDLPISASLEHRSQYGQYMIGMKKEWGMAHEVTPVRYIHRNSPGINSDRFIMNLDMPSYLQQCKNNIFRFMVRFLREMGTKEVPTDDAMDALPEPLKQLLSAVNEEYLDLLRHGFDSVSFVRSYEGEWEDRATQVMSSRIFYNEREWRAVCDRDEVSYLPFKFSDVNHLIVQSKNEAEEFATFLAGIQDSLEITATSEIWRKIKVASELFPDV